MVESAEDIMRQLDWDDNNNTLPFPTQDIDFTFEEKKILTSIAELPEITPGELSKLLGIPIHNILAMLVEMELKGWISHEPGNRYRTRVSLA